MKKIKGKKKLLLYGCSGMGVNLLGIVIGSYLCSALLTGGFIDNVENWTYLNKDLVIGAIWAVLVMVAKVLDGVIDLPLATFTDSLKTKWGRRRPALVIGLVPLVISYVLFLLPISNNESLANTIWFAVLLCIFYAFYTLTMLTFYATFSEVTETEDDMVFLSNVKSVCDVVYFILGFALLPIFVNIGMNIRIVALIFLPLVLFMLIPLFLLKEKPTNVDGNLEVRTLKLKTSLTESFKNKKFVYWMFTISVMTIGTQLYLGGINEFFSNTGLDMTTVMASAFAPVPFTIILYNKIVKKWGLGVGYRYSLIIFSIGMIIMFLCNLFSQNLNGLHLTLIAILGGIFVSFAIGSFFSITYTVPSHLAQLEQENKKISISSMYFAVQGLFEGVASGIATGLILVTLKETGTISYLTLIVAFCCMITFAMSFFLSDEVNHMGKENRLK